jgi:phosphohistidine phosphatase
MVSILYQQGLFATTFRRGSGAPTPPRLFSHRGYCKPIPHAKILRFDELIAEVYSAVHVYLVRHGDAVPADVDPRRPLSARGREAVNELAQLSASRQIQVAEICHSGILRAQETAEILADYLRPPRGLRQIPGLLPDDDPQFGKTEIETADEPILLVGHLPYMKRLAVLLAKGDGERSRLEFGPATMICCSKIGAGWQIDWQLQPRLS